MVIVSGKNKYRKFALGYFHRSCSFWYSTVVPKISKKHLKECCQVLQVCESPTEKELRDNFIRLAKDYHPDSGSGNANAEKFTEVQNAYKTLREHLIGLTDDTSEIMEKDFGIRHTVPQHRQYLSYEGVGHGTPGQRQKQYQQHRLIQGTERVYQHRMQKLSSQNEKTLISKDATLARQYKTSHALERFVEDMIQESMARGEFDNLPGSGKPLKFSVENPYVDSMTQKLNQILINNGFVPEWITLDKEIKEETQNLRKILAEERSRFGSYPLGSAAQDKWNTRIKQYVQSVKNLNLKIDKFNMSAPQTVKQKIHFRLEKEAQKILETGSGISNKSTEYTPPYQYKAESGLFDILWKIISKQN